MVDLQIFALSDVYFGASNESYKFIIAKLYGLAGF